MKKLVTIIALIIGTTLMSGCIIHVGAGDYSSAKIKLDRSLSLDASELSTFDVYAKQGDIKIIGVDGSDTIEVKAKIRMSDNRDYTLELKESGSTAYFESYFSKGKNSWSTGSQYIDLVVYMPSEMALKLEQGSGDLTVENIKNGLQLDDSSGDTNLTDIKGSLEIKDTSGDLDIRRTDGDITLEDGSGDIDIYDTTGNVRISDGSGDIYVKTAKSLTVLEGGSGDTDYSDIETNVSLRN